MHCRALKTIKQVHPFLPSYVDKKELHHPLTIFAFFISKEYGAKNFVFRRMQCAVPLNTLTAMLVTYDQRRFFL